MSRVTIDDITGDYYNDHTDKSLAICDVEVVPRKIVEMIIERCSIGEKLVNKTTAMEFEI